MVSEVAIRGSVITEKMVGEAAKVPVLVSWRRRIFAR